MYARRQSASRDGDDACASAASFSRKAWHRGQQTGVGSRLIEEAFAVGQSLGWRALVHALADETLQVHRAGADHQHPVGLGDLRGAQLPLGVAGILHFDAGTPASPLGCGGQQARSARLIPGRWGRQ